MSLRFEEDLGKMVVIVIGFCFASHLGDPFEQRSGTSVGGDLLPKLFLQSQHRRQLIETKFLQRA